MIQAHAKSSGQTPWTWLAALAGVIGFVVALWVFYPGFMSYDSLEQLRQARAGRFGDWYPPTMAWIWRLSDTVVAGPAGMLVLQLAMMWAGLVLIARRCFSRAAWMVVALVGFWPPVFAMSGVVWKDVQMAGAFTLAVGLLLSVERGKSRGAIVAALGLLIYGTALRHNALAAAFPLAAWAGWLWLDRVSWRRAVLTAAVASLFVAVAPRLVNAVLTNAPDPPVQQVLFAYDLYGMSVLSGRDLFPPEAKTRPITVEEMQRLYPILGTSAGGLHFGETGLQLKLMTDGGQVRALGQRWLESIRAYPEAYLGHRRQVFSTMLGFRPFVYFPYHRGVDETTESIRMASELGIERNPRPQARWLFAQFDMIRNSLVFRLWLYVGLLALAAGWGLARLRRDGPALLALGLSGLFYVLPLFLIAPAADFRYNYWTIIVAMIASAVALRTRGRHRANAGRSGVTGRS